MERRFFLKALATTGAYIGLSSRGALNVFGQKTKPSGNYDLVAVLGGEPAEMFRKGIEALGGMKKYVKKGQKVVVKPNIGWDKTPDLAANTNPELVGEIVKQCFKAGAKEVVVFDHTCDHWVNAYTNSGIQAAAVAAGAKVVPADTENYYEEVTLNQGISLKSTKIHKAILDCDVWINVPILKTHGGAKMTVAMKNLMGINWDRRWMHRNNLPQCIADLNTLDKKPILNVVDAYRVMQSNGPRGKTEADVVMPKALFLSSDIVAVDTAAIKFFNQIKDMPLSDVKYLKFSEQHQIGTMNMETLNIKRIKI